jgi:membrane protease YdiL (CAAX protease family)
MATNQSMTAPILVQTDQTISTTHWPKRSSLSSFISVLMIDISAVVLIGAQHKIIGFILLALAALSLLSCDKGVRRDLGIIYFGIALLGVTPISTNLGYLHLTILTLCLIVALAIPYLTSRYVFLDHAVRFRWSNGRAWAKHEILYIFVTAVLAYLLLPYFLRQGGSYLNWMVPTDGASIFRLFLGTNVLGIWDELFFICIVLGLLRRHFVFWQSNLLQAVIFISFLYELGFRGWSTPLVFVFALIQGFIFRKTESLHYVVTIHLVADLILFLVLLHLHHAAWFRIFIT